MSRPQGQITNREPATEWEYRTILLKLAKHWGLMIELFWETGIRTSEALAIVKTDVEKHGVWVTIEKRSDHPRVFISISDSLFSRLYLYAHYSRTDRIWPYTAEAAWLAVKKGAKAAGLRSTLHPHSFRHSYGYRAINTDIGAKTPAAHIKMVQELMHHKDIRSTMVYTNPTQADVDQAQRKMIEGK